MHSPTRQTSTQYRSAVFYLNEEQKDTAKEIVNGIKAAVGRSNQVYCDVQRATRFYQAEKYHQDFLSKRGARF